MMKSHEPNIKNPFLDFSSIFWLIAELFIASFLCLIPIVKSGVLNEHTLTQGMIIASIFLILSEFFRRFFRQLWQPFFLLTFFISLIIINPILCAIFFLLYLLFQVKESIKEVVEIILTVFLTQAAIIVEEKSKEAHTLSSSIVSIIIFTFIVLSLVVLALYGMITNDFELLDMFIELTQIPLGIVIAYYFGGRYYLSTKK